MSKRHGGRSGDHRRSLWTVFTPGATGPADDEGHRIRIPQRAHTFDNRKRAQRFAGNVQGSKMVRSGARFWTFKRVLIAIVVVVILVVALT